MTAGRSIAMALRAGLERESRDDLGAFVAPLVAAIRGRDREPYVRPSQRQRQLLAAYVLTGSIAAAADLIGVTPATAGRYMAEMRERTHLSTARLIYFGGRDGWLATAIDTLKSE